MEYKHQTLTHNSQNNDRVDNKTLPSTIVDQRSSTSIQLKNLSDPLKPTGCPGSVIVSNEQKTAQLKTKITHSTKDFTYTPGKKDKRGVAMEAWLDPHDPVVGSATGAPQLIYLRLLKRKNLWIA